MTRTERKIMSDWEFALEHRKPRWVQQKDYGQFTKGQPISCEMPEGLRFQPVTLPHDWAVEESFDRHMEQGEPQGFRNRWGIGWYRRHLELKEKKPDCAYWLDFGGVYENCSVWVNGKYAGGQNYGYTPFRLDVTEILETGENLLLVKVDNTTAPVDRWYSGCGIYRTVKLVEAKKQHLEAWDTVVHTQIIGGEAVVTVDSGQKCEVRGLLEELGVLKNEAEAAWSHRGNCEGQQEAFTKEVRRFQAEGSEGSLTFRIPEAKLWSAQEPNLYQLTLMLGKEGESDSISLRIGLRTVEFLPNQGMYVNGQEVKLKGVCLHQEAGCVGIAADKNLWRKRLEDLKEMGCNALRPAHHMFAEEFLDLCDEMGFYIYEECFDKWTSGLYGRYFETDWQQDVEAMVKRDRNRPSIVIWGVGNEVENQGQDSMLKILKMLRDKVRSLDQTRPVTYAMNPHFSREKANLTGVKDIQKIVDEASSTEIYDPEERVGRIAKIGEIVDLIACNYQEQWYELIHEHLPDKLILGTEVYQYFQGHYEQMQNYTQKNPSLVPLKSDYCIGSMIWTGYDYLGESMGYPAKGWGGALLRTNGEKRPAFYLLQSYWRQEPMVHFSVLDQSQPDEGVKGHWDIPMYADHWHFPQFNKALIPYMIATNCQEAALYLNGKRYYLPKPSECPNGMITGYLPWEPGEVKVVGIRDGREVCSHITVTPKPAVQLAFDAALQRLQAKKGAQLLCTVRAVDQEGNPCFREGGRVSFRVEGAARILGVDNGDITGSEFYRDTFIHLYRGCASAVLEFTGEPGRVSLWADGAGLRSAQTVICVDKAMHPQT